VLDQLQKELTTADHDLRLGYRVVEERAQGTHKIAQPRQVKRPSRRAFVARAVGWCVAHRAPVCLFTDTQHR
jgi:hypothetical protein